LIGLLNELSLVDYFGNVIVWIIELAGRFVSFDVFQDFNFIVNLIGVA